MKGSSLADSPPKALILPQTKPSNSSSSFEYKMQNLYFKYIYTQEDLLFKVLFDKKHRPEIYQEVK